MSIKISYPGSYSCIVDRGRYRFRKYGVPISGAMDIQSAMRAHSLIGNPMDYPLIETYMSGLTIEFLDNHICGIAGATGQIFINNQIVSPSEVLMLSKGDNLRIGALTKGARTYLSFKGHLKVDKLLGSSSSMKGHLDTKLTKGQIIKLNQITTLGDRLATIKPLSIISEEKLCVAPGPEWDMLTSDEQEQLLQRSFLISGHADRIGYRLKGQALELSKFQQIYSAPVMPGTIQMLESGLPIILMRDCQTTGGYPRILQVDESSMLQLAQRKSGDTVRLQLTN